MPVAAPPAPVTVLRLSADPDGRWAAALPAVPPGQLVTVSTSAPAPETIAVLRRSGYVYIGEVPDPLISDRAVVDVVVPGPLAESDPAWWRAATSGAEAVVTLAHGPVARVFGGLVATHRSVASQVGV